MSEKLEIPEWTGSALTNAAFANYATGVLGVFMQQTFAALALDTLGPEFVAAVRRFSEFVNRQRAFDATDAVAAADAKRDALFKALWHAWHFIMELDADDPLHQAAAQLKSEMTAYKGVWTHEINKETTELNGLQRDFAKGDNTFALQTLGLSTIATALFAANHEVELAVEARLAERNERVAEKGTDTTPALRKAAANLLIDCCRQVNAANRINATAATTAAVTGVCAVIEQYKLVAAEPKSKQGKVEPIPPNAGGDAQSGGEASAS